MYFVFNRGPGCNQDPERLMMVGGPDSGHVPILFCLKSLINFAVENFTNKVSTSICKQQGAHSRNYKKNTLSAPRDSPLRAGLPRRGTPPDSIGAHSCRCAARLAPF